jgi:DnaK suppressor protein
MPNTTRPTRSRFDLLEKKLVTQRNELRMRIGNHRLDVVAQRGEPDDEAAQAYENVSQEMLVATLERERRTLREIESALLRIKNGEYGICSACGEAIPKARLEALPWARVCVPCAEHSIGGNRLRAAS